LHTPASALLGIVAGFVEQRVPSLPEEQGQRRGNGVPAKPGRRGAVTTSADGGVQKGITAFAGLW
jgi:hypothetical protein